MFDKGEQVICVGWDNLPLRRYQRQEFVNLNILENSGYNRESIHIVTYSHDIKEKSIPAPTVCSPGEIIINHSIIIDAKYFKSIRDLRTEKINKLLKHKTQ